MPIFSKCVDCGVTVNLADFVSIDLSKLSDEVIFSIYNAICKERSRRLNNNAKNNDILFKLSARNHNPRSHYRKNDLERLLKEDWSGLFTGGDLEKKYYVYAHVSKCPKFDIVGGLNFHGLPFYIGKGTGRRAYDLKRNEGHGMELKKLLSMGRTNDEIVRIITDNLTEDEALTLESKLIYFFGTKFDGKKNGILVNLDIPKIPYLCI